MLTVIRNAMLVTIAAMAGLASIAMADRSVPTAEELTAELDATQRQVRLILGDVLRHDAFDVPALLDEVDNDPEALARWVREHTTHVPYQGLVRGDFGVLQDRLGNHLDRAMMLARLIDETGRAVRLEVSSTRAPAPSPTSLDDRPRPPPVALSDDTRELLVRMGSPSDPPQPDVAMRPEWNRFDQDLQIRAASLMERLAESSGFPAWHEQAGQQGAASEPNVRVWWQDDQGNWSSIDLSDGDLSAADPAPPDESQSLSAFSSRHAHHYDIAIVAERWQEGRFDRVTLLEHDVQAHRLAMQPIRVGIVPEQLDIDEFYAGDSEQALAEDLLGNTGWVPYIRYGEERLLGDLIDDQGRVRDLAQPAQARQMEEASSLLGGISVGGRAEQDESRDAFIGLSLEVTHRHGDEVVKRLSRPWFSLAAEDMPPYELEREQRLQRGVALLRDTNMVLQTAEPSEALLYRMELGSFLRNAYALQGMTMGLEDDDIELLQGAIDELVDLPKTAMQFARHRFTASLHPGRLYIGEPNILIEHVGLKQLPEGFRDYRAIDLAHVPLHAIPDDDPRADDAQQWRFAQGVLETLLEAELLAQRNPPVDRVKALDGENAALRLETAMAKGQEGLWLTQAQARGLDDLTLSRPARQAMQAQLARGQHLYFPLISSLEEWPEDKPFPHAWWSVDPLSGQALGYGGMGWGSFTDYSLMLQTRLYLLKASLAPTVAKSTVGTHLVCGMAVALTSLKLYSSLGNDLHWSLSEASGQAERVANFCANVVNNRISGGS
ncbi:hypothetical protein C1H70_11145 [Halomonas urumqiensis]|uniref:Uncharacterized protein n=2 Tax=Halomonas urumqiensis TaxID=1684789 RepID=A0A2N7UGR6_9GAMM|nr:hypothetical protein C1H70_11145 [Halomonas urumqiensis]PTB03113.1 hypothetical protein C6V82_00935 [Halomonas urumqiensis]